MIIPRLKVFSPGWNKIASIGRHDAIRSSYIFLVLIPAVAKMLMELPEFATLTFFQEAVKIYFSIPFSWIILYWSAVFISVGNLTYSWKCPDFVKHYPDFQTFEASGRSKWYLATQLNPLLAALGSASWWEHSKVQQMSVSEKLKLLKESYKLPVGDARSLEKRLESESSLHDTEKELFSILQEGFDKSKPVARKVASAFYMLGFGFLLWIFLQNLWYVLVVTGKQLVS